MFTYTQIVPFWAKLVLAGLSPIDSLEDGVFIMCHRNRDNFPLAIKPKNWASYQNSGEIADGVLVVDGKELLLVSVEEVSLKWSSGSVNGGGTTTTDRMTALSDWNGKENTASQIENEECADANYAPGYCASYSKVNINGQGMTAGRWWLPSLAQLMCMYSNMNKINYALSMINGASQLTESAYWSSTESSNSNAWILGFQYGNVSDPTKVDTTRLVRPVSTFLR